MKKVLLIALLAITGCASTATTTPITQAAFTLNSHNNWAIEVCKTYMTPEKYAEYMASVRYSYSTWDVSNTDGMYEVALQQWNTKYQGIGVGTEPKVLTPWCTNAMYSLESMLNQSNQHKAKADVYSQRQHELNKARASSPKITSESSDLKMTHQCKRLGDFSGNIQTFSGFGCPVGWIKA